MGIKPNRKCAGEYQDRRNLSTVDCSNTIWILATNAFDNTITSFCDRNPQIFSDNEKERKVLVRKLSKTLKADSLQQFGVSSRPHLES